MEFEPEKPVSFKFAAKVVSQGWDCGGTYLIDVMNSSENSEITPGRYYADNLPSEYKVNGLEIVLNCRCPNADESYPCTTMRPTFPHVYVLEVQMK